MKKGTKNILERDGVGENRRKGERKGERRKERIEKKKEGEIRKEEK